MANNRMYLRCKACGEIFFLGKRFGNGYYISQYEQYKGVPLMERLNKFYDDHEWCGDAGLDCFELIYEVPPKPANNADRIRTMSDEKMARLFTGDWCEIVCGSPAVCDGDCEKNVLAWLEQEARDAES